MQPPVTIPPIVTNRNPLYGAPNAPVTQKYRPLEGIQLIRGRDIPLCTGLLAFRRKLLSDVGMLPAPLGLKAPDWPAMIAREQRTLPPLIVVSTNRSNWIASGVQAASRQLERLATKHFDNVSDLRALTAEAGQTVSPPIYCPARLGDKPNRNVYVLVHMSEYKTYRENLAGTDITPIGWSFKRLLGAEHRLVGFGASRYAAIEFCKELRRAGARWGAAWLFDDNVVALTSFAGLDKAEDALGKNRRLACAAFHGGSTAERFVSNRDWARKEIEVNRGGAPKDLPESDPPGILQQAILWNIDYFIETNSNFGVVFVTSAEDVSLGSYFDTHKVPYLYYKGVGVRKEETVPDGARNINTYRQDLHQWITDAEAAAVPPATGPPPPTTVEPADSKDGGVQLLSAFVVGKVLPNSGLKAQQDDPIVQQTAKSQAVEQIISQAIAEKVVDEAVLTQTFQVNGGAAQVIERLTG
jgi:hypothetical protein